MPGAEIDRFMDDEGNLHIWHATLMPRPECVLKQDVGFLRSLCVLASVMLWSPRLLWAKFIWPCLQDMCKAAAAIFGIVYGVLWRGGVWLTNYMSFLGTVVCMTARGEAYGFEETVIPASEVDAFIAAAETATGQ